MTVVKQAIQQGSGQRAVTGKRLIPTSKVQVRCHDDRGMLVELWDDLEDEMSLATFHWQVADLINDQELMPCN